MASSVATVQVLDAAAIASPTSLSESPIWALQRAYFREAGIGAWRDNVVPSYVTTNPFIAESYGELLRGFLGDCRQAGRGPTPVQPFTIVELGAGSGRFALHLISRLSELLTGDGGNPPFRYVMTDISAAAIAFWRDHPRFAPFIADGRLDFAICDTTKTDALHLAVAGTRLHPANAGPFAVIANYVFDTIPQDLFEVAGGRLNALLAEIPEAAAGLSVTDRIASLTLRYHPAPCPADHYGNPACDAVLADYGAGLKAGAFLFPSGAIACLDRLRRLTDAPMLVLACDRGHTRFDDFEGADPPQPLAHGSFSLPVNFHALAAWAHHQGGLALLPDHAHASIAISALSFGLGAAPALRHAYDEAVDRFGPDDFFMIKRIFDDGCDDNLTLAQMLALLRLSRWDPALFSKVYDDLVPRLAEATPGERRSLAVGLARMWARHLDLGEEDDLAFRIGSVLAGIGEAAAAIPLLEASIARHGSDPAVVANLDWCRAALGERSGP